MPAITRSYSDLDLDFIPHPISGDVNTLTGVDAVKRSIRNLILSNIYDRPFRPNIGSGIAQLLFEPISPLTQHGIETAIRDVLRIYEKTRTTIVQVKVDVNEDMNGYNATITFAVDSISEIGTVSVFLERVR